MQPAGPSPNNNLVLDESATPCETVNKQTELEAPSARTRTGTSHGLGWGGRRESQRSSQQRRRGFARVDGRVSSGGWMIDLID